MPFDRSVIAQAWSKKTPNPNLLLAQSAEIQSLIAAFECKPVEGSSVTEIEILLRAAFFKTASELMGHILQQAVDRIGAAYTPKPGEQPKGPEILMIQGIFGTFPILRRYFHHPGKHTGHFPADAALGLVGNYTRALARLIPRRQSQNPHGHARLRLHPDHHRRPRPTPSRPRLHHLPLRLPEPLGLRHRPGP